MPTVSLRLDVHCSLWPLIDIIAITMATWILHLRCDNIIHTHICVYSVQTVQSFCDYVIYFRTAKVHDCSLPALCTSVHKDEQREVVFGIFYSPRIQTCGNCRKKLLNDRNGKRQFIVGFVRPSGMSVHYW